MTDTTVWPHHELGKELSNWGRWGDDDQIGTLNFITQEKLVASAKLVRTGKTIDCGIPFDKDGPFPPGGWRRNPHHLFTLLPSDSSYAKDGQIAADDIIIMGLQASTQWDGLAHVGYDGYFYNGVPAGAVNNFQGASKNDIAKVATKLVSRGVLLDIAGLKGVERMSAGQVISAGDLDAAIRRQGTDVGEGDVVLIRTGHGRLWMKDNAAYGAGEPGLGLEAGQWLCDRKITLVGTDTWASEAVPHEDPERPFQVHQLLLVRHGIYNLENLDLEDLARDRVYEFAFVFAPLRLKGATGSPGNPIAVR